MKLKDKSWARKGGGEQRMGREEVRKVEKATIDMVAFSTLNLVCKGLGKHRRFNKGVTESGLH